MRKFLNNMFIVLATGAGAIIGFVASGLATGEAKIVSNDDNVVLNNEEESE